VTRSLADCNRVCYNYPEAMRSDGRFALAVHVLAVLAHKEGSCVSSNVLSSSANMNPVIIRRLLLELQTARLIETKRGARSGSKLSRAPSEITLAEVYSAVRCYEPFGLPKRRPNRRCPVGSCIRETLIEVFSTAREALERELGRKTLAGLIQQMQMERPGAGRP